MLFRTILVLFVVLLFTGCNTTGTSHLINNITFPYNETENEWNTKYSDEPYVFLLSDFVIEVHDDFSYTEDFHLVIKIQKEEGKKMGEFPLPFDSSRQVIKNIQASVKTPDGRILEYSSVQDITPQQGFAVYSDNKIKVITLPNVVIGSVIDIQGKRINLKPTVDHEFFKSFHLKKSIPIKYLRRVLIAPKDMPLTINSSNTSVGPDIFNSGKTVHYTWKSTYNDKLEREEYMPHPDDVLPKVSISTITDWEHLSKYGWSLFEKNLKPSAELKETVKNITVGLPDKKDQIQAIIEYIQDNFRYVSLNIDFHNYEPHSTKQIFYNKYGDCKDQTLLAIAMLSEIGVTAYPALISSQSDLVLSNKLTPMLNYFDHAILGIEFNDKINYSDILMKGHRFWETSSAWSGANALLLTPEGDTFSHIPIVDKHIMTSHFNQATKLNADSSASGVYSATLDRYTTLSIRELLKGLTDSDRERWLSAFASQLVPGADIQESRVVNLEETYSNLEIEIHYTQNNWAESINDMLVFGMGKVERNAEFSAPTRINPIEFRRKASFEYEYEYSIPESYEVISLPEDLDIETDFAYFRRTYTTDGSKIMERVSSGNKRVSMPASRYEEIKSFYDDLISSTKGRIAIRMKL